MVLVQWLSILLTAAVLVPALVVAFECLVAVFRGRGTTRFTDPARPVPRLAVLVPAHDEEALLGGALASLAGELKPEDRLVVIAHNCSDRTAEVARRAGAEVLEVFDDGSEGKPAALRAGVASLDADPPEVVLVIDADCRVTPGSIATLARMAHRHGGPVQAAYLFAAPTASDGSSEAGGLAQISSLALLVKNFVRPLGLRRLGLPSLLNGSGSAYPFLVLRQAPQGEGSIAEDYQLAVDLALRGYPTYLCPQAEVASVLPSGRDAAHRQRRRWEHGHLQLVFHTAPRLLARAVRDRNLGLLALALELAVPPLSFLVLAWSVSALLAAIVTLTDGASFPLVGNLFAGAVLFASLLLAWLRYAGPARTFAALASVPRYVVSKVPLYLAFWSAQRETRWTKTPRDDVKPPVGP